MATPDNATVDGYDDQMQTNHLSHFLLTAELFPLLEKYAAANGDARIVNHSSGGRHMTPNKGLERRYFEKNGGNLGGSDMPKEGEFPFGGPCYLRYFQTKLANAVFTRALNEKLKAKEGGNNKIKVLCADPGMSATSLANHIVDGHMGAYAEKLQTAEDGAMGIIKGMMHPNVESGKHYGPATTKGPAVVNEEKPYEVDPDAMKMLWETSQTATGVVFEI